jgi:hypothetical protein
MRYTGVWKVLEEMIADFRKRKKDVPPEVMDDLKSAKTMIRIFEADPNYGESAQRIEEYLGRVESYLVSEGQRSFGTEYFEEWTRRLVDANKKVFEGVEERTRYVQVPRGQRWIRVMPTVELSLEKLVTLAEESDLSHKREDDGSLLVYGDDEGIKRFVKKMVTKYGSKHE